jgi:hypothetical protein
MNSSELPPADARHIVRRYVHDLNNIANCLQLELSLIEDDIASSPHAGSFRKLGREVAQLEMTIRSLGVRFAEPSACVVSAYDVFQSWRDKVEQSGPVIAVEWELPAATPLINVDFNALLTVLREICLFAGSGERPRALSARLYETDERVVFEIRERFEAQQRTVRDADPEITEWERITAASGGAFQCSCDRDSSQCVTTLSFPKAAAPPTLFQDL